MLNFLCSNVLFALNVNISCFLASRFKNHVCVISVRTGEMSDRTLKFYLEVLFAHQNYMASTMRSSTLNLNR